jgi:hypothetical protein
MLQQIARKEVVMGHDGVDAILDDQLRHDAIKHIRRSPPIH